MHDLTHLDLFSGIGGFALAAQAQGFRTVGFAEIEPYACRVLEQRFPGVPNFGDVRRRDVAWPSGVTVLSAGYPCQPASLAGKRKGERDDRWLWPAARDLLPLVRPAWFIGENVFGHVTMGLDDVLADLENLGYSAQPFVVPACAVGAWHRRDRVWIIAHSDRRGELQPEGGECNGCGRTGDRDQEVVADVDRDGRAQGAEAIQQRVAVADDCGEGANSDALRAGLQAPRAQPDGADGREPGRMPAAIFEWPAESPVVRVVHGIPHRPHRIKGLGNAIVPQVAEQFFQFIAAIESGLT